ncbi:MAG: hypothetical protein EP343_01175 [Deltaproteobacteria bacterium]|nr:MAG: hypothetical protein EP343_01175 [Deltaproteobacteria bacterium]
MTFFRNVLCLSMACWLSACSHSINIPGDNNQNSALEGVACGDTRCDKGLACHFFQKNGPLCVGEDGVPSEIRDNDSAGASMTCDGPEDCSSSETCVVVIRATFDYSTTLVCRANPDSSLDVVCRTNNDCPSSHPVCKQVNPTYMGSYKACIKKQ